jgi:hypothetical protein
MEVTRSRLGRRRWKRRSPNSERIVVDAACAARGADKAVLFMTRGTQESDLGPPAR